MKVLYKDQEITTKIFLGTGQDTYTSEEQVIGQWTDGKPLYRRSFEGVTGSSNSDIRVIPNSIIENLDVCVSIESILQDVSTKEGIKVPISNLTYAGANHWFMTQYSKTNGIMSLIGSAHYANLPFISTIKYTKTTDSPVSTISTTPSSGTSYVFGHGFQQVGNTISVQTVDNFDGDNTLPMSAHGVQLALGNVEALLATI